MIWLCNAGYGWRGFIHLYFECMVLPAHLFLCSGRGCCQGSSRALLPPLLPYMRPPPLSVQWPGLLPGLVESLVAATAAGDLKAVGGILATANSIFKRYRWGGE